SDGSGSGCAVIYYTTDGSAPGIGKPAYVAPINIAETTTLKFMAMDNAGNSETPIKSRLYEINPTSIISFSSTGSGTMTCTPTNVYQGGSFVCRVFPNSGYHLQSLTDTVDVTAQVSGNVYTVNNVSAGHNIVADFSQNLVLRLWGTDSETWYQTIQNAYNAASSGDDILALSADFTGDLYFNRNNISIALQGGCERDFYVIDGWTVLSGKLTIGNGTVTIEYFIIK
ncbi:MAG: chitobiase/beta-hexosaminidase C-terminal domain-containing protein, partial [Thermodesulfovibrionales bacterium]